MRKILTGSIALAALTAAAPSFAADLPPAAGAPVYYSSAPAFDWTGFYAGADAGYAFGSFSGGGATPFGGANSDLFGLSAGYNFQITQFVVGVEGDVDWGDLKSYKTYLPGPINEFAKTDTLWSLRGRIGYALDNVLLYATGGYVAGVLKTELNDATVPVPVGGPSYASNKFNSGYVIGAGLEYALNRSFSVKAEYLYRTLDDQSIFGGAHLTNAGLHESLVRGGVNYHF
jgi:outer membrane immunogenic protein